MTGLRAGVYPGTFDPVTKGHLDIIQRAAGLVDRLVIAVATNVGKEPLFPLQDRVAMLEEEIHAIPDDGTNIEVRPFDNLLMDFVDRAGAQVIIRGLRAVSDFEYEFQMAGMNHRLNPRVETLFLMASESHHFIASRFVKDIARLGGDVSPFVSPAVKARLERRFAQYPPM